MNLGSVRLRRSEPRLASASLTWRWGFIAVLLVLAVLGNLYVIPGDHIVAGLFAIVILLAALWFETRPILIVTALALIFFVATSIFNHEPFLVAFFGFIGLLIVGYLAADLARERRRAQQHATEMIEANERLSQTEERLRIGLSLANVTITNQDVNLNYTAVYNARPELPADALLENAGRDLLSPADNERLAELKRRVIETGIGVRQDLEFTIGGVTRSYDMRIEPLRDRTGAIAGIIGSSTDITSRKQAEETRRFESTILTNIRDSVIATDLDGLVTYWNRGAEEIFGYSTDDVLRRPLLILDPEDDPTRQADQRERILAGDEFSGEILERRRDGRPVWADLRITPLRNAANEPIGFLRVASDITERKRLETEREELLRREQTALQQLQQFVALVAHDLDQPLTTILGVAQLLQHNVGDRLDDRSRRRLLSIEQATRRMSRLTADLRQAIAIGSGHFSVESSQMDLMQVARSVVAEQQQTTTDHRIHLTGPEALVTSLDRDRVVQLLSNLISNAIKYSPQGGDIDVNVTSARGEISVAVRDFGIGMTAEQIEQLFEPFSRVHSELSISGTGLGLYIAKGIVEAHGGSIDVESAPGQGSTFRITFPVTFESDAA